MASDQGNEGTTEWRRLYATQLDLRSELAHQPEGERRNALLAELEQNRAAISELEGAAGAPMASVASGEGGASTAASAAHASPGDDGTNVDDLFDSLGLNDPPTAAASPGQPAVAEPVAQAVDVEAEPPVLKVQRQNRLLSILAGAMTVALLVALGGVFWALRSSGATETTAESVERQTTDEVEDLETEAGRLRGLLDQLGLDAVDMEVSDGVIHLSGAVASEQDLSSIRGAVVASADPTVIDMSQVEVVVPAASDLPPDFRQPTLAQQEELQEELVRVLAETPLVFDVDSTELNDQQKDVLQTTVIRLLESHPGVPVRLVGYTDSSGSAEGNALLSLARANAVRDYLISQGVPEFILRTDGRGTEDASGDSGADRRVEIEVIFGDVAPPLGGRPPPPPADPGTEAEDGAPTTAPESDSTPETTGPPADPDEDGPPPPDGEGRPPGGGPPPPPDGEGRPPGGGPPPPPGGEG